MSEIYRKNLANILVNYSLGVKPGEWVAIGGDLVAAPLVNDLVEQILLAGGYFDVFLNSDEIQETRLRHASQEQLQWCSPSSLYLVEHIDAYIEIMGTSNTRYQSGIDPARLRARKLGQKPVSNAFFRRFTAGELRWVGSLQPCHAFAQEADMSLREYEAFVYSATLADRDDPLADWQRLHADQERLVNWLKGRRQVQVRGPHVHLDLSIEGRTFFNEDGKGNMPGGEIFTGPVEDSTQGWVEFTYPAIAGGREVDGVRLEFENGQVTRATARKNEDYLLKMLDTDAGSRRLGEFAIGTNYGIQRFTKNMLFDEKMGGSIHMAVGRGIPETGSQNDSAIHWDMLCDMRQDSEIRVDGELFYKDGQFQI